MGNYITPAIVLGVTGIVGAIVLFIISRKFAVKEDPRVKEIEEILPGANCGACGRKGCHDFAVACCESGTLTRLLCPGAGVAGMARIAAILGIEAKPGIRRVAFVKCNGTCDNRIGKRVIEAYDSCSFVKTLAVATDVCQWGCLGCGDCVDGCRFNAIKIDGNTGIAVVDTAKCTGCGICATNCPQGLIELHNFERPAIWIACVNRDKGAMARKECKVACIGCGKCMRTCQHGAISLRANHATIDGNKCIRCGECVDKCPTGAIHIIT